MRKLILVIFIAFAVNACAVEIENDNQQDKFEVKEKRASEYYYRVATDDRYFYTDAYSSDDRFIYFIDKDNIDVTIPITSVEYIEKRK